MAEDKKTSQEEATYSADRLIAEGHDRFGHPPHVVAGAIASLKGGKKNFTVAEVDRAIDSWLKRPVDTDNPLPTRTGEEE